MNRRIWRRRGRIRWLRGRTRRIQSLRLRGSLTTYKEASSPSMKHVSSAGLLVGSVLKRTTESVNEKYSLGRRLCV